MVVTMFDSFLWVLGLLVGIVLIVAFGNWALDLWDAGHKVWAWLCGLLALTIVSGILKSVWRHLRR